MNKQLTLKGFEKPEPQRKYNINDRAKFVLSGLKENCPKLYEQIIKS